MYIASKSPNYPPEGERGCSYASCTNQGTYWFNVSDCYIIWVCNSCNIITKKVELPEISYD